MNTSEKIRILMKKGILVSPDAVEDLNEIDIEKLDENVVVLDKEKIRVLTRPKDPVRVVYNYNKPSGKRTYNDFVKYLNHRFNSLLEKMLKQRQELERLTSIKVVAGKREREGVSIIGMVKEKKETTNGNIMLELEDKTDVIKVLISKEKTELFQIGKDIVLDEVIGVTGIAGNKIVFVDSIIFPDVPLGKEIKKGPRSVKAVFISDIEVGSKNFMEKEWEEFLTWINSKEAKDVKYLFIVGDLVAGVGVFPGQEEELSIMDIREQYNIFAEYIKRIPSNIQIIICTGNHDAGRLAEPQLPLYKDFGAALYALPNTIFVSNPSIVNIEETDTFEGFFVMLYHGYSMPFFADNIPSIRSLGGQKRPDLILEFYMKRRHLAPTHTSNLYIPDTEHDPMVIENVPDILATGHIHRTCVHNYRGVTLLNCSTWTGVTESQTKRGLDPQPAKALVVDLKTRNVEVKDFE